MCSQETLALGLGEKTAFPYASEETKIGDRIMTPALFIDSICRAKLLQNSSAL